MTHLLVKSCGAMTSLQDLGRIGHQRFGVSPAGAMDRPALAVANALVGNAPGTGAIELAAFGAELVAEARRVRVAVAGADFALEVAGMRVPPLTSATAAPGETIRITNPRSGLYGYLAVGGGLAVPTDLGSISLHLRSGLGGLGGRLLAAGDRLALAGDPPEGPELTLIDGAREAEGPIRVVLGPQDDYYSADGIATFLGSEYRVTSEADRMGLRLAGPRIAHAKGSNIVSDGIVTGAIQVPGGGEPIVLMADRQTTGGYPKLAVVATADIARLAQMRPGSAVRFRAIARGEAVALARAASLTLARRIAAIRPATADLLASERLLGLNLAGDATSGEHHQ